MRLREGPGPVARPWRLRRMPDPEARAGLQRAVAAASLRGRDQDPDHDPRGKIHRLPRGSRSGGGRVGDQLRRSCWTAASAVGCSRLNGAMNDAVQPGDRPATGVGSIVGSSPAILRNELAPVREHRGLFSSYCAAGAAGAVAGFDDVTWARQARVGLQIGLGHALDVGRGDGFQIADGGADGVDLARACPGRPTGCPASIRSGPGCDGWPRPPTGGRGSVRRPRSACRAAVATLIDASRRSRAGFPAGSRPGRRHSHSPGRRSRTCAEAPGE